MRPPRLHRLRYNLLTVSQVVQILEDQHLLTTKRTRMLLLRMLPEGESAADWERTLLAAQRSCADGDQADVAMWQELAAQVCVHTAGPPVPVQLAQHKAAANVAVWKHYQMPN